MWVILLHVYDYRQHIVANCSPEVLYYDDDTGEGSDELKKVTIQTKEKVDDIIDLWHAKFGAPNEDQDVSCGADFVL